MRCWLERTLNGCRAADDESADVLRRIKLGTTFECEVKTRRPRSGAWHRRYWLLMSMIAGNIESIDIGCDEPMPIHDAEDVHLAMKLLTGHVWTYTATVSGNNAIVRIPKPTNFSDMSADEWPKYWNRVLDAVHQHVLPGVSQYAEEELARLAS